MQLILRFQWQIRQVEPAKSQTATSICSFFGYRGEEMGMWGNGEGEGLKPGDAVRGSIIDAVREKSHSKTLKKLNLNDNVEQRMNRVG